MKTWLKRICKTILGIFIVLFMIGFISGMVQSAKVPDNTVAPVASIAPPLTQDPVLVADMQQLGINYSGLNLSFTSQPITSTIETADEAPIGGFLPPNTIRIQAGLDKVVELNILAYEYMHYAWAGLTDSDRQIIGAKLDTFRTMNADFNADVSRYHGDAVVIQDEEDSTACTRVDPSQLSTEFNNFCNHFIPNRYVLFE